MIGIQLDDKDVGLSYTLRENLPSGCSVFGFAQEIIGKNAYEIALLAKDGKDDVQRGVGIAVLTAGSRQLNLPDEAKKTPLFGMQLNNDDIVGMIGYIPPIVRRISESVKEVIVFDQGVVLSGSETAVKINPTQLQFKVLPKCAVVIITGTTMVNGTIEELLPLCRNAREIVLVGTSTPMYPEAYLNTGITSLAGSWWNNQQKEDLFKRISLSGGINQIQQHMIKKMVRVNDWE